MIRLSAWFGIAALMFMLASLFFLASGNMKIVSDEEIEQELNQTGNRPLDVVASSSASYGFYSTVGLIIAGIVFIVFGFIDMFSVEKIR